MRLGCLAGLQHSRAIARVRFERGHLILYSAIRGHVFCSFLALVLRKALQDRCAANGFHPEWQDVCLDIDRLQEVSLEQQGKRMIIRTPTTGVAGRLFQAVGIALPPNIWERDEQS